MAKSFFLDFFSGYGFLLGVLLFETGSVPVFHGNHGVVGGGKIFFFANGGNPCINDVFVGRAQAIVISFLHCVLEARPWPDNP